MHEFGDGPVRVSRVHFPRGVVTHWHRHEAGQVLVIVEGTARVQTRGGPVELLGPADTHIVAPGVDHWHGAADEGPMTHIAISGQATTWGDAPKTGPAHEAGRAD